MSDIVTLICVVVHIFAIIIITKNWKYRSLLHPGLYFSIMWVFSTISEWIAIKADLAMLPNPDVIDELNIYAAYTSLVFSLFSFVGKKKCQNYDTFRMIDNTDKRFMVFLIALAFTSVVISWFKAGANFSFAANRYQGALSFSHINKHYTLFDSVLSIVKSSLPYITIGMGYFLGRYLCTKQKDVKFIWMFLPLFISFIEAMYQGGRISILSGIKNYAIGLGFSLPLYTITNSMRRKFAVRAMAVFLMFLIFISAVGNARSSYGGGTYTYEDYGIFGGVMEYMTSHYWGYQLRRIDYANGLDFDYGINTFYGLLDFKIPFSAALGINGNLWAVLGIDYDPLSVYKSGVLGANTTSTQFMPMVADFGLFGTYIYILIAIYITQKLFLNVITKEKKTALSFCLFYVFFCYWFSSNFNSGFMSLYFVLLAAIIYDVSRSVLKQ